MPRQFLPPVRRATSSTPAIQRRFVSGRHDITPDRRSDVSAIVREGLSSAAEPLDTGTRADLEPRLGWDVSRVPVAADLSSVRVHTDMQAAASASALDAEAYTVRNHIVFGPGRFRPDTPSGRNLLVHELTHVMQQRTGAASGVQRQSTPSGSPAPSPVPRLPPMQTFAEQWREFEQHREAGRVAEALALAPALIATMAGDDAIDHAGTLALWLLQQGQWTRAQEALRALETAWLIRFVSQGATLPSSSAISGRIGPAELLEQAKLQASAGHHDRARELFGLAFLFLQMQLIVHSERRMESLAQMERLPQGTNFALFRLMSYADERSLLDQMRQILGFYPRQERQALATGQAVDAQRFHALDTQLRARLREHYLLTGSGESVRAITMEATRDTRRGRGTGYVLHGTGTADREEFVTPLPGTPRPDELGRHPAYTASMEEILETITGQEDFLTEITGEPAVRAAFRGRAIDMNDLTTRLTVWRVMYGVFQSRPTPGCSTALCSLLRLMERYLRAFTTHTEYDIRDFGTSYLQSEFPEDLLGRLTRDCGVYALKVAYELYRTARGASPRLGVGFQLYHTLDHATVVITDQSTSEQYVLSNNQVMGPRQGDPAGAASIAYGSLMGRRHATSIGGRTEMLTTGMSDATFRQEIWERYKSGARLALRPEPPAGATDTRTEDERREATYTRYYEALALFDRVAIAAETRLNDLTASLRPRPRNEHSALMTAQLAALTVGSSRVDLQACKLEYSIVSPK